MPLEMSQPIEKQQHNFCEMSQWIDEKTQNFCEMNSLTELKKNP